MSERRVCGTFSSWARAEAGSSSAGSLSGSESGVPGHRPRACRQCSSMVGWTLRDGAMTGERAGRALQRQ